MRRFPLRFLAAAASLASLAFLPSFIATAAAQDVDPRLETMKIEALELVEGRAKLVQEIVDQLFSFGELGFQEFETQRYLTGLLEENGFEIELGIAGMPSAWTARWGSGRPVIALGSDVDGIPQSNQKPGVGYREPILSLAPGHGETSDKKLVATQKRYFVELRQAIQQAIDDGKSLEEIKKSINLPWYKEWTGVDVKTREENIEHVYGELTGKKKAKKSS